MHFPSVGSTNVLALEAAQAGARGGVWVADEQTAGRGRGGHGWHSVAGDGLYVSALVTPTLPMTTALLLSLATGLAAKAAIAEVTGLDCDIRWPNDLMLKGRKCGGILVETAVAAAESDAAAMLRYAVIGVGINLNHVAVFAGVGDGWRHRYGWSWASEFRERRCWLLCCGGLDEEIRALSDASGEDVLRRFAAASSWVRGKRVRVEEGGGYTGVTDGLDSRGFLRVVGDDGVERTVLSGGVREI